MKKITISVPDDFPSHLALMSDYLGIPRSRLITRQMEAYFKSLVDRDPDFVSYLDFLSHLNSIAPGSGE